MHKLKHGDRVTCEIDGIKIDDARISVDNHGGHHICQNKKSCFNIPNKLGFRYSWFFEPQNPEKDRVTNLTVIPRTLDDLMVGDEVENGDGDKQKVLARVENLVALSKPDCPDEYWYHATIHQLKEYGHTLVQSIEEPIEEPIEELTMEEVCKRLGKRVKIKK